MAESSEIRKMEDALKKAETSFHVLFEKMNASSATAITKICWKHCAFCSANCMGK